MKVEENIGWLIILLIFCRSGDLEGKMQFDMTPPGNMYLPSASDLELTCSITNSSLDVILIHIDNKYNYNGTCNIHNCDGVKFDRFSNESGFRALTVRIPNVTVQYEGTYYCFYGDPPGWESLKGVYIADLPSTPENLSCISYNFENLQCITPFKLSSTGIPLGWTLKYHLNSPNGEANCSYNEANSTIVCPPVNISKDIYKDTLNITLVGQNTDFNVSINKTIRVLYDFSIVKPKPASNVRIHHSNGSEVTVFWDLLLFASKLDLVQRIKIVSLNKWTRPQTLNISIHNNSLQEGAASFSHRFTNLIPNGQYSVSISWKPEAARGEKYWSFPTHITFVTQIAVPGQSVTMTNGSFYYQTANTTESAIVLYWKNPEDRFSHGQINKYRIEVRKYTDIRELLKDEIGIVNHPGNNNQGVGDVRKEIVGRTNAAVLHNVYNKSFAYMLNVWAGNNAGYSVDPATIQIPVWNKAEQLRPSWVVVERDVDRDRVLLTWSLKEIHELTITLTTITLTTVYSCACENPTTDYFLCMNFGWKHLSVKETQIWMNKSADHIFAMSVESSSGLSGGMVWQSQSFIYGRVPDIPTYIVNSDPVNHTVLNVTIVHGGSNGGRPEKYKVFIEELTVIGSSTSCPEDPSPIEYEADFSKSVILLAGLQPGTDYVVCLSAKNNIGESLLGMPTLLKTSSAPAILADGDKSWAIGLGICFTIFLLFIAVCVIVIRVKQTIRKSQLENRIETIEVMGDQYKEEQTEEMFSSAQLQLLDVDIAYAGDELNDKDSGAESAEAPSPEPQQIREVDFEHPLIEDQDIQGEVVESCQWSVFSNSSSSPFISQQDSSAIGLVGYQPANGCSSGLTVNGEIQDLLTSEDFMPYGSDTNSLIVSDSNSGDIS